MKSFALVLLSERTIKITPGITILIKLSAMPTENDGPENSGSATTRLSNQNLVSLTSAVKRFIRDLVIKKIYFKITIKRFSRGNIQWKTY